MKRAALVLTILIGLADSASLAAAQEATLTLPEALARVLKRSPLRAAEQARAEAANAALRAAGRFQNPSLELRSENWRSGESFSASRDLDVFAVLSQPLELTGQRGARRGVAEAEREAARARLVETERNVALETVSRFLEVARGRELVEALDAQHRRLSGLVETMQRRVQEGYAAEADLMKFRTEASRAETQLVRARVALERDATALGYLLGEPVRAERLIAPALIAPPAGDPDVLAREALEQIPVVVAARARAQAARRQLELERSLRFPASNLEAGYKRTGGYDTAVLGLVLTVPVFDRNGRSVAVATGEERAAALQLEAVSQRVRAETASLVRSARALWERARRAEEDLLHPAEVVQAASQSAFREGAADVLQLVDAERVYAEARRETLELQLQAFLAVFEARLALGQEMIP